MRFIKELFKNIYQAVGATFATFISLLFMFIVFGLFSSTCFFCQGCASNQVQVQNVYTQGVTEPKIPVVLKSVDSRVTREDLISAANWWNATFEELLGCNENRYVSPYCEDDIDIVEVADYGWVEVSTTDLMNNRVFDETSIQINHQGQIRDGKIVLNQVRWNQWTLIHSIGHTLGLGNDITPNSIMNIDHQRNMFGRLMPAAFVQLKAYTHRNL